MYSILNRLCEERGVTLAEVSRATGIPKSVFSELKAGRTKNLSAKNIAKLSSYLNVTQGTFWGDTEKAPADSEGMAEYLQLLRDRPETRMLLDYSRGVSKEDIEAVAEMIKRFKKDD